MGSGRCDFGKMLLNTDEVHGPAVIRRREQGMLISDAPSTETLTATIQPLLSATMEVIFADL